MTADRKIACPQLAGEARKALLDPRISRRYNITPDEVYESCRRVEEESIWLPDPIDPPRLVPTDHGDDYLLGSSRRRPTILSDTS